MAKKSAKMAAMAKTFPKCKEVHLNPADDSFPVDGGFKNTTKTQKHLVPYYPANFYFEHDKATLPAKINDVALKVAAELKLDFRFTADYKPCEQDAKALVAKLDGFKKAAPTKMTYTEKLAHYQKTLGNLPDFCAKIPKLCAAYKAALAEDIHGDIRAAYGDFQKKFVTGHSAVILEHFCDIVETIPVLFTILSLVGVPGITPWTYSEAKGEKRLEASIHARKIVVLLQKPMPPNFTVTQIMIGAGFFYNRNADVLKHVGVTELVKVLNLHWLKGKKRKTEKKSKFVGNKEVGTTRFADLLNGRYIEDVEMMEFHPDSTVFRNYAEYPKHNDKNSPTNHEHLVAVQVALMAFDASRPRVYRLLVDPNLIEISHEGNHDVTKDRYKSVGGKSLYMAEQYCINGQDDSAVRRFAIAKTRFAKMEELVLDLTIGPNGLPTNQADYDVFKEMARSVRFCADIGNITKFSFLYSRKFDLNLFVKLLWPGATQLNEVIAAAQAALDGIGADDASKVLLQKALLDAEERATAATTAAKELNDKMEEKKAEIAALEVAVAAAKADADAERVARDAVAAERDAAAAERAGADAERAAATAERDAAAEKLAEATQELAEAKRQMGVITTQIAEDSKKAALVDVTAKAAQDKFYADTKREYDALDIPGIQLTIELLTLLQDRLFEKVKSVVKDLVSLNTGVPCIDDSELSSIPDFKGLFGKRNLSLLFNAFRIDISLLKNLLRETTVLSRENTVLFRMLVEVGYRIYDLHNSEEIKKISESLPVLLRMQEPVESMSESLSILLDSDTFLQPREHEVKDAEAEFLEGIILSITQQEKDDVLDYFRRCDCDDDLHDVRLAALAATIIKFPEHIDDDNWSDPASLNAILLEIDRQTDNRLSNELVRINADRITAAFPGEPVGDWIGKCINGTCVGKIEDALFRFIGRSLIGLMSSLIGPQYVVPRIKAVFEEARKFRWEPKIADMAISDVIDSIESISSRADLADALRESATLSLDDKEAGWIATNISTVPSPDLKLVPTVLGDFERLISKEPVTIE